MSWLFLLLLLPANAEAVFGYCPETLRNEAELDVRFVRPTQFSAGMRAVVVKMESLGEAPPKKLPVIFGPGGVYQVDRQHLGLALLRRGIYEARYKCLHDWRNLSTNEFEQKMIELGYVRLRDAAGSFRNFGDLPCSLGELEDDPYRSLAFFVRRRGGFAKSKPSYFSEFAWADFFRMRVDVGTTDEDFDRAVGFALQLARSPDARHLPGAHP